MREVLGIAGMVGSDSNNNNNNDNKDNKDTRPGFRMSSQPGYLELSQESMDRLVCHDPIEDQYEVEDQPFARGKFAAVRRCRHRKSGLQYAAKFLKKHRRSADLRPEILHEVAILDACAASQRIVRLHKVFESQHDMVLLLELAPGGELQMLLDNDEIPEEAQVKRLMRQILDGLLFLHSINVAHLDLKPQNLVLTGEFPQCDVKLCDLGISRYISDGADIRDILGTPDYVAPEVLNYESISLATDMWSVGVLLYVLLTGCSPFGGDSKQETFCNISQCNLDFPEDLFEDISEDVIDLMRKLMVKEPSNRLSAKQCLEHRWFTSVTPVPLSPCPIRSKTDEKTSQSPSPIRKQLDSGSQSPITVARAAKHKAPVETTITDKPSDFQPPAIQVTKPEIPSGAVVKDDSSTSVGMKSFRRENFKRNLSELAERLSKTNETNAVAEGTKTLPKPPVYFSPVPTLRDNSCYDFGTIRKSKSMHMLSILNDKLESRSVVEQNLNYGDVRRRNAKDCLYSFRKCVVIEDDDVSPPMSIAGSVTSSVASDNSICDSGSEVSELSIDSSSDRSSIISLDDSVEYNTRTGRYTNVWNKRMSLVTSDAFSNAFRRFSTVENGDKPVSATHSPRRPARAAHTVALNKNLAPSVVSSMCKLEFRKERHGNVVVIREVKAGRFLQVSEVKCETVQERIRRLLLQGAQKT